MINADAQELEYRLLDVFWSQQPQHDRLELLKGFATIKIDRPSTWDPEAVRAEVDTVRLSSVTCFCCRNCSRPRVWHHVIQIQHGGSNYARNRVALCGHCHARVHPWLPVEAQQAEGFQSLRDLMPLVFAELERIMNLRKNAS